MADQMSPDTPNVGPGTDDAPFDLVQALMEREGVTDDPTPDTVEPEAEYDEMSAEPETGEEDELLDLLEDDAQPADEEEYEDELEDEEPEPLHTVKVDGEELQVPYEELVKGYSRQADYTRKTQQLSQERQQFLTEREAVQAERQQYAVLLNRLQERLTDEPEPNWAELKERDPVEYAVQKEEWRERKEAIRAAEMEKQRLAQQQMQEQANQHQARLQQEKEQLLEKVPEWADPEVATKEQQELVEFATDVMNFTTEEVAQVYDHRVLLLLRKAAQMHRLEQRAKKTRTKKQTRGPAPAKPGNRRAAKPKRQQAKRQQAAMDRLRQDGSVNAAAAALLAYEQG